MPAKFPAKLSQLLSHPGSLSKISSRIEHQVLAKVQQHVDAATGAIGQRVSGLESQVGAVQRRVEQQEDTLHLMFERQMARIEELLVPKRQRKEGPGE